MKKNKFIILLVVIFSLFLPSCETLKQIGYVPEVNLENVAIKNLDLEGITFTCAYSITNPYPLSFSVMEVNADVKCEQSSFVKLKTEEGITIQSRSKKSNEFTFKIPYTSIISTAANMKGKKSLPFTIEGNANFDAGEIPLLEVSTLTIPFSKSFEVPVFKPEFSVSNPKLQMPTLEELKNSLINNGMGVTKALTVASQILSGKSITESLLNNLDLNLRFTFDVNVRNEGSAPWKYELDNCSLNTTSGVLADIVINGSNTYTDSNCVIPVTATLNTVNSGKFIVQLLNKSGKNPEFKLDSKMSFPELKYKTDLPLSYSCEIPLDKVIQIKNSI